jgi:hypothetical protein
MASSAASGMLPPHARAEQRDGLSLAAGVQAGDDVAEPLGAGDPGGMQERGQAGQLRALGQPGGAQPGSVQRRQPGSAGQRPGQRVADVMPCRVGAAGEQLPAGELRGLQKPGVVAGQHRHCPRRAAAADGHDDTVAAPADVSTANVAQVGADQPGAGAEADQRGGAHPPRRRGLGIGERQVAADLGGIIGSLGPLAGQRRVRRVQVRHHPPRDEPQVRAQRAAGRPGQPRRVRGEPLDHRRVQQHGRHRLQLQPDAVTGELPGRPQQVPGPVPAVRPARRHHLPGERCGLGGRRRWLPARGVAGIAVSPRVHTVDIQ